MTCCTPIPCTISENIKVGVFLGGMVVESFQSTSSSCKLSGVLHSVCRHQNREYCHIVGWDNLWEEEDNIVFDRDIPCVIFAKMTRTSFYNKNDYASEGA